MQPHRSSARRPGQPAASAATPASVTRSHQPRFTLLRFLAAQAPKLIQILPRERAQILCMMCGKKGNGLS